VFFFFFLKKNVIFLVDVQDIYFPPVVPMPIVVLNES